MRIMLHPLPTMDVALSPYSSTKDAPHAACVLLLSFGVSLKVAIFGTTTTIIVTRSCHPPLDHDFEIRRMSAVRAEATLHTVNEMEELIASMTGEENDGLGQSSRSGPF
jgi:hypothetical protein